jgi:hypothetical protein
MTQCGCRTGGKWVGAGSSGIKNIIAPSQLIKQPSGVYKLKPRATPKPPASPKVAIPPVKTAPTPPTPISAKPTPVIPKPKQKKLAPIEPTINDTENAKLPPTKLVEGDGGCVRPLPTPGNPTKSDTPPVGAIPQKESVMKIDWINLSIFYLTAAMLAIFAWIVYGIYKDNKKAEEAIAKLPKKSTKKTRSRRKVSKE